MISSQCQVLEGPFRPFPLQFLLAESVLPLEAHPKEGFPGEVKACFSELLNSFGPFFPGPVV